MVMTRKKHEEFKRNAAQAALDALNDNVAVLDTETTGLDCYAEVIEVAIINVDGSVAVNHLNKPILQVPREASEIHGINNWDFFEAQYWGDTSKLISNEVNFRQVAIYNADYDMRVMQQTKDIFNRTYHAESDERAKNLKIHSAICVMKMYAAFWGDWNEEKKSFRWQKLTNAAEQQSIEFQGQAHRALADAQVTLELLKRMADYADKAGVA